MGTGPCSAAARVIRAVLDTSVLVQRGPRRALQLAAADGRYTALWSPWIIAELHRVLTWRWIERTQGDLSPANHARCSQSAKVMMRILTPTFELIDDRPPYPDAWASLTDEDDVPIWAAAISATATHVVSNNTRHFPPRQADGRRAYNGIEYLTAADFLTLLDKTSL